MDQELVALKRGVAEETDVSRRVGPFLLPAGQYTVIVNSFGWARLFFASLAIASTLQWLLGESHGGRREEARSGLYRSVVRRGPSA